MTPALHRLRPRRRLGLDEPTRQRPITSEGLWYGFLSLVSAIVLFGGVISAAAVSPTFCAACHGDAVEALAASAHAGTRCDSCHISGGALGLVEQRLNVVSMVAYAPVALLTGSGPGVASTDNAACLDCHDNEMTLTATTRGITMNHRAPRDEQWLCTRCHLGTAHPNESYAGSSYSMDLCLACHNANPQNITTCGVCHPADESPQVGYPTAWAVTHGANWRTAHGMGDLTTCKTCHSPGYCAACHNMDLPHPGNYLAQHGTDVLSLAEREADCIVCHKGAACDNCHGIEMPHPDAFMQNHPTVVDDDGTAVCTRCHDQSACDACHERHVHPGIPEDLLEQLQERPVTP